MSDQEQPKRRGRPPKYAGEGKRQNFSFRIRDKVRERLVDVVKETGRSLSEEIEWRIEKSFEWDDAFLEASQWTAAQKIKFRDLNRPKAMEFLKEDGWYYLPNTPYGAVLVQPGSWVDLGDGWAAEVLPAPPGATTVQLGPRFKVPDGVPPLSMSPFPVPAGEIQPAVPAPPAPAGERSERPPQAAPPVPDDWEERVYRAIRRALQDEREQDLRGEKP